ncbi:cellulase family glycosylhydrolase [Ktedonobacter racemifer]|uniref:Endoglucanase n=1 Tax=Ktedonobacter racemifer DSM 44963 TaxID=485913 RepID=D6U5X3_KTERA|nr:cellulase family glycosylhydrolase [Ktedonobacter racemifer]EFH80384.1 glycoside hydrolase family 5 [Ktedonobacter racemifer DSM 44963]
MTHNAGDAEPFDHASPTEPFLPHQPTAPPRQARSVSRIVLVGLAILLVGSLLLLSLCLLKNTLFPSTTASAVGAGSWHTDGSQIYDDQNQPVRIAGVNWSGFETETLVVHGLATRNYKEMLDQIKDQHYNTLRLPYTNHLFDANNTPIGIDYTKNQELSGLRGLQLLDKIVEYASQIGLHIILDRHRPGATQQEPLWYTAQYPESRWIADWQMLAQHYKNNSMVIGADLHNEPRAPACWGCGDPKLDWQQAAQRAGNAILSVNPNWLIFIEGVECYPDPNADKQVPGNCSWWGSNLKGVATHPVQLQVAHRLVYSVHDYPVSVYPQLWFKDPNFPQNLSAIWDSYWGYIQKQGIAPVWVGEFGTRLQNAQDKQWLTSLVSYLGRGVNGINWTFWSWNPDSVDTGGLLQDDWTHINQEKQNYLQPILYPFDQASPAQASPVPTPHPKTQPTATHPTPSPVSGQHIELYYQSGNGSGPIVNQIQPQLKLVNTGTTPLDLSTVTIRYWYTPDSAQAQQTWCDYVTLGCEHINQRIATLTPPRTSANSYLELSFTPGAGSLPPGGDTGGIKIRFNKTDWSNYNENNDYSFNAHSTSYQLAPYVTVYIHGHIVWGSEPA